jgi:hypothetical protein
VEVNQKIVREINGRLASGTEEFAFYHQNADWLTRILPKQNRGFFLIRW